MHRVMIATEVLLEVQTFSAALTVAKRIAYTRQADVEVHDTDTNRSVAHICGSPQCHSALTVLYRLAREHDANPRFTREEV